MQEPSTNNLPDNKSDTPYITAREREIDSIVVEELFSSSEFQSWLLKKIALEGSYKFHGAWKSYTVNSTNTEIDIFTEFDVAEHKTAILIENKIDSPERPRQPERYRETGEFLVKNENFDQFVTCLLCPEKYLKEGHQKYDYKIFYEELLEWFEKQPDSKRMQFKQLVIKYGIERVKTGYKSEPDDNTDRFFHYYEDLARDIQPELEYRKPKLVAGGNSWVHFTPSVLPSKTQIIHKRREGFVDLHIPGIDIHEFSKQYENKLEDNMTKHKKEKSIAIQIMVSRMPDVSNVEEPERYKKEIIEGLQAADQLMKWYLKYYQK